MEPIYHAPESDVIGLDHRGILCASGGTEKIGVSGTSLKDDDFITMF